MITVSTTLARRPATHERRCSYVMKTNVNAILTGLLHACQRSREVVMARYTPALGRTLGAPIFLDAERDTVFLAQPPARAPGPPHYGPTCYSIRFEQDLEILRHVALPPITYDMFSISLVNEFPELKSVILPGEENIRLDIQMGMGSYMVIDNPQRKQEAFEALFMERWLKGRRELGLEKSGTPKIIWMSKAELYSKVENEKVIQSHKTV